MQLNCSSRNRPPTWEPLTPCNSLLPARTLGFLPGPFLPEISTHYFFRRRCYNPQAPYPTMPFRETPVILDTLAAPSVPLLLRLYLPTHFYQRWENTAA